MTGPEFDWYQFTVRASGPEVQVVLLEEFRGAWLDPAPARFGYAEGFSVRDQEGRRGVLQMGGPNGWPNVTASSVDSPGMAALARHAWPEHEVTRVDSKIDLGGEGSWDRLSAIGLQVAEESGIKVEYAGDWRPGADAGRTLYFGARSSACRVRIYEKGLEERAKKISAPVGADVVRLEIQVRPEKSARKRAAVLSPLEVWGFSKFGRSIYDRAMGTGLEPVPVRDYRESNDRRAVQFMVQQYGPAMLRQAADRGGRDALLRWLSRMLDEVEERIR